MNTGLGKELTILLTEDDTSVRDLIAYLLQREGYSVLKARHSQEALFVSGDFTGPIHLLLTDMDMSPYMNGFELARRLRLDRPNLKLMYVSGYVEDESLHEELVNGAVFLPKPFTPRELIRSVSKALDAPIPAW